MVELKMVNKVIINFELDEALLKRLEEACAKKKKSISDLLSKLIEDSL
jgi:hypothetical protein